jgi:hypothetical protein
MDHGANAALLCVLCLCACTAPTGPPPTVDHATTDPPRWRFDVEPYLWLPSTSGTGTTNTTPPLEIDLVGTLDAAFPLAVGATSPDGELTVITDGFYVRLNDDEGSLQTTTSATMIESGAGLAVDANQRVTALIGLRWVDIDYDVRLGTLTGSFGADWVDPWIGARAVLPLNDTFAVRLRGDVGGFGVGTDFTWQAIAVVATTLGSDVTLDVGYRGIALDYETSGASYDVLFHGPIIGLALSF